MKTKSRRASQHPGKGRTTQQGTTVGNISGGKGFAIGTGARSVVVEIGSLLNLDPILKFIKKHWIFLIANILLQLAVYFTWASYKDRFLIPFYIYGIGAAFLEVTIAAGAGFNARSISHRIVALVFFTSTAVWGGMAVSEVNSVYNPLKFPPEVFGVAVAQFGEGPDFDSSIKAREISQIVLEQLAKQAQEDPDLDFVQFKPIGLIKTKDEAFEDGSRIGADLVIWGQLQISATQTILHFSIIETPDKVSNPMFPRALPLYDVAASSFFQVKGQEADEIFRGTNTLSAFTFGLANFFKRDFGSAARAFEEALTISSYEQENDYHYLSYFYYGLTLQRLGRLEEANVRFQQAISIHPDDPAPWVASAFDNNSLGNFETARQQAQTAFELSSERIQAHPDDYVNYFNRAQANEILQDWEAALADYEMARDKAPDAYISYIGMARIQIIMNRPQDAAQSCKEAIQLAESRDANPAWAYLYLGHTYQILGESNNARAALWKAVELAPKVDYMHYKLGQYLENTGNLDDQKDAEEEYKSTILLSDNKAWAISEYAKFLVRQNRLEEAVIQYRSTLQCDPKNVVSWIELAGILEKLNRNVEAREAYNRAIEINPNDIFTRLSFGTFLFSQGEYKSAINEWEFARQMDPNNCNLLLNLGQAYETINEHSKARNLYLIAISLDRTEDHECQEEASRRINNPPP